jgi:5-amino-6-(5-phosphoribosylamino)uracil reductase
VAGRPYVLLSAAMSADGYIDDASDRRLILSGPTDLDRVDAVRAGCDAILVGARTVRRDNPGLRIRSAARRADRLRRGQPAHPVRVTVTGGGDLDPGARFFAPDEDAGETAGGRGGAAGGGAGEAAGGAEGEVAGGAAGGPGGGAAGAAGPLVYVPQARAGLVRQRLGGVATVIGAGDPLSVPDLLADLAGRGIGRLMVEGGATVLAQFLAAGLADELQLAVAPLLVADPAAPRLLAPAPAVGAAGTGGGLADPLGGLRLTEVSQAGRMAVLRYRLIPPEPE